MSSCCPKKSRKCKRNCGGRCDECRGSRRDDDRDCPPKNDCCACPTGPRGRTGTGGPTGPGSTVPGPTGPGSTVPGPTGPAPEASATATIIPYAGVLTVPIAVELLGPVLAWDLTFGGVPSPVVGPFVPVVPLVPQGFTAPRDGTITELAAQVRGILTGVIDPASPVSVRVFVNGIQTPLFVNITGTTPPDPAATASGAVVISEGDFIKLRVIAVPSGAIGAVPLGLNLSAGITIE